MAEVDEIDLVGMSLDEAMEHYGVKGMKWGVRKSVTTLKDGKPDASGATRKDVRAVRRQANRQRDDIIEDFHELGGRSRDQAINSARASLKQANRDYRTAKDTYKSQKAVVGKNEAKKALVRARAARNTTDFIASRDTNAEQVGKAIAQIFDPTNPKYQINR